MIYSFSLAIQGALTDDMVDRLYEAGCDDALVSCGDGRVVVDFDLNAETHEAAVMKAEEIIRRAGVTPRSARIAFVVDLPPLTE